MKIVEKNQEPKTLIFDEVECGTSFRIRNCSDRIYTKLSTRIEGSIHNTVVLYTTGGVHTCHIDLSQRVIPAVFSLVEE